MPLINFFFYTFIAAFKFENIKLKKNNTQGIYECDQYNNKY